MALPWLITWFAHDVKSLPAVERLFDAANDLDFFNKQSIYVYLCEISGLEKKQLVKSMSKIRKIN